MTEFSAFNLQYFAACRFGKILWLFCPNMLIEDRIKDVLPLCVIAYFLNVLNVTQCHSYYPSLISGTGKCIIFTLLFCVAGPCMQASMAAIFSHERPQAVRAGSGCHACLHGPATQKRRGRMMHSARLADKRRKIVFYSLKCR